MMSTNEECPMEIQTPSDDGDERSATVKLLYDWISAEILGRQPIPERLLMKNVFRTWRGTFQLITFCGSENRNYQNVLFGFERLFTISDVGRILSQCGSYLKELSLSEFCNSSIMPIVGEYCKNLTKLEFVFDTCTISKDNNTNHYIQAFTQLNKLVSIKIQVINTCKNSKYIGGFPIKIINYLPEEINEIHLFFEWSSQQKKPVFFNLKKFKHLHSLTMRYCNLDKMIKDISKKSTLIYLDIRDSWVENESWVFDGLENLKHIDLPPVPKLISSDVVTSIFHTCKHLEYFEISPQSWDVTEPKISHENWANLENLVHFCIWWKITDDFATKMVKYCQKLKYLDCKNVCGAGIEKLTELKNLKYLKFHDLWDFSTETLFAISYNCKKLKHLELPRCKLNLTVESQSVFIDHLIFKLQYLEYLDLSRFNTYNSVLLKDSTIILIADGCKYLKYLNIGGKFDESFYECQNLTETAFDALTSLENLEELTVDHNIAVTNNFVKKLKGLKFFSCVGCHILTASSADGIIQLIKNCPNLEQLVLGYMPSVTLKTIIAAADLATKDRNSGIILYIRLVHEVSKDLKDQLEIESQYLVFVDRQGIKYK